MKKTNNNNEPTFIARQAIYDQNLNIYAYELLYRQNTSTEQSHIGQSDADLGDIATWKVISNTLAHQGFEKITGNRPAFINFTYNLLLSDFYDFLPPKTVVIEILEEVNPDETLIKHIKNLIKQGYKIALDDFVFKHELIPLIQLADFIKIDVLANDKTEITKHLSALSGFKGKLIAEKIEDYDQLNFYRQLGFDYFQGFFLTRPEHMSKTTPSPSHRKILRLISQIADPACSISKIELLLNNHPSINQQLLHLINSNLFSLKEPVKTIQSTTVKLSLDTIRSWVVLLTLTQIEKKPIGLIQTTLVRARMCYLLAEKLKKPDLVLYFTVGLFSTIEAVFDMELNAALNRFHLEKSIKSALLTREGTAGKILTAVIAYERGHWDELKRSPFNLHKDYQPAYLEAITWTENVYEVLELGVRG